MNKKTWLGVLCATALCSVVGAGLTACAPQKDEWQVGAEGSSVTATAQKREHGYRLTIKGNGAMQDFATVISVPWLSIATQINEIVINDGVTAIGANAFAATRITSLELPESMQSVGRNAVTSEVDVYAFSDEVEFAVESKKNVYIMAEELPELPIHFWQSDKSQGDIIDPNATVTSEYGGYWHFDEEGAPVKDKATKVLFIGNSFTYRNGVVEASTGVPGIFDNIAKELGYYVETFAVTGPGWQLSNHALATDTCGKQVDMLLNAYDDFDLVVLQEQSTKPLDNYTGFVNGVKALQTKINDTQKNAKIYLYETWGSPASAPTYQLNVPQMEQKLFEAYTKAGEECGLDVTYVGRAFSYVYVNNNNFDLWMASDHRHQGYTGAYLSACVHVANMLGGDVRTATFKGEAQYSAPALPESTYTMLRNAAYDIVFGDAANMEIQMPEEGGNNPGGDNNPTIDPNADQTKVFVLAVWGRFITEEHTKELMADFKTYCDQNNVVYDTLAYRYYEGATSGVGYYAIAKYTEQVAKDGNTDVLFPAGNNINTSTDVAEEFRNSIINKTKLDDVQGNTTRYVAWLNDDALTQAFLTYLGTESAKTIMAKV